MRDAIGPLMGEGPANAQRNVIAIAAVKQFNMKDLDDFTQGKDSKFEKSMNFGKIVQTKRTRYCNLCFGFVMHFT